MDLGLGGLKVILAGASKGIGRAVAEVLIDEGANIAFCARDQGGIDETVSALSGRAGTIAGTSVEITDAAAYKAWIDESAASLGGCDIFMCFASAGGLPMNEESWAKSFEFDMLSTWRGVEAALPHLRQSQNASIVIISSSVVVEPSFGPQTYSAMKAAVTNYGGALATRLAPEGIRVNTVSPGIIFIEGGDWDKIKQARPEAYEANLAKVPFGRLGNAPEVARAIAFAASPACPFLVGANLVIDGGLNRRIQH